jgi:LuxR family maltose regulon positive regulatory protein
MTLVSAHAGTGKTVLLSGWCGQTKHRVAWVSIDRRDNTGSGFWLAVDQSLQHVVGPGWRPRRSRLEPDAPLSILTRASALEQPVTLVLDDLHELERPALLEGFGDVVRQAPPQLRFVVATRSDPAFPIHRLRLSGELTEVRAAELAFTHEETRGLLGDAGGRLSDEGLDVLRERTEGWAAGIRLAALTLVRTLDADGFVADFAGDDRSVADYLVSEVLARQPAHRRDFLLATSIATRLSVDLAALLSGRPDAAELLEQIEAENLFLTRVGTSRVDFRYHRLFREFLRAELKRSNPELLPQLHERAAAWTHAHGEPFAAIEHAVGAQAWEVADQIAAESWEELLAAGDSAWLRDVLEGATLEPGWRQHHSLRLLVGLSLLEAGEAAQGATIVARALGELDGNGSCALASYATAALARRRGDAVAAAASAQAVLELPAVDGADALRRTHVRRAVGGVGLGSALVALGDLDAAERVLDAAHEHALEEHLDATIADAVGQLALLEAARGRLRRAAAYGDQAATMSGHQGASGALQVVGGRLACAWVHLQWDELDDAEACVEEATAAARICGDVGGAAGAALVGALVDASRGANGADRGLRRLRGAFAVGPASAVARWLVPVLATAEARLLAARGDLDAAWAALEALEPADDDVRLARAVTRARLQLALGRPQRALGELEQAWGLTGGLVVHAIEAELLAAVAHSEEREREAASARIGRALELAAVERYRRVFVEGGPAVQALLVESVRHGTPHRSFVGELLASFERRAPGVEITKPELLEPLSSRERAVLRYLPTLMSNTEIAGELFLSVNTVKTHLRSIYRKLGATRRREAVERARRLELL